MTVPPATGPSRPAPPPLRLPRPSRHPGGFITSLVVHGIILLLIARFGVELVLGGGDDRFGPRGGGGGAGGSVHLVDLPAAAAPAPAAPVQQPVVHTPPPQPDPAITLPPPTLKPLSMTVAPVVSSVGTASDGTSGQGPGTGGGTGSGTGPGVGSDSGPASGGNGAYITPPSIRTLILPADCAHGQFTVRFWIAADGRVTRVTMDPELKSGQCKREMMDKMMSYQFEPARARDGTPVAGTTWVKVGH
jgi:protein TonB